MSEREGYVPYVHADRIEAEFNERRENDSYWRGRRDGTELFAAKEAELVASQLRVLDLNVLVDDLRAQLRKRPLEACWHCQVVLEETDPPHCELCPAFNNCSLDGCDEPGCE